MLASSCLISRKIPLYVQPLLDAHFIGKFHTGPRIQESSSVRLLDCLCCIHTFPLFTPVNQPSVVWLQTFLSAAISLLRPFGKTCWKLNGSVLVPSSCSPVRRTRNIPPQHHSSL